MIKNLENDEAEKVNRNHITLSFFDFNYSPDIISKELELTPHSIGIKGDEYMIGSKNQIKKIRDYSIWSYEWKSQTNEFIGDIIERFIVEIILPRMDKIKKVSLNSEVQFQIVQYYYDGCNPGIFIKSEHTKILSEINSSIDIDIYCLSENKE